MKVIIRADSSTLIGYGHVMRCLTIASYLKRLGHKVKFYTFKAEGSLETFIIDKGFDVELLRNQKDIIHENTDWLIVDHYELDINWEREASRYTSNLLVIDDLNRNHHCSILLDATLGKSINSYSNNEKNTKVFIGAKYCILRPEFIRLREDAFVKRNGNKRLNKILISFGGTDNLSLSKAVVEKLKSCSSYEITIVSSNNAKDFNDIKELCKNFKNLILLDFVENIHELFLEADVAIGAAGTSSYERASLGLPTIMIPTADNQKFNVNAFSNKEMAIILEKEKIEDIDKYIQLMANKSEYFKFVKNNFDNVKPLGFINVLEKLHEKEIYSLREANHNDIMQVYKWQSYPGARKFSRNTSVPSLEEHTTWFKSSLGDSSRRMFILSLFDIPLGFVRVDLTPVKNEVSILISHGHYGQGLAKKALTLLRNKFKGVDLHAYIEEENIASIKVFKNSGYKKIEANWYLSKG